MTFRRRLAVIRNMIDGALLKGNLDKLEVRQTLCDMLYQEFSDLEDLAEADDGADE